MATSLSGTVNITGGVANLDAATIAVLTSPIANINTMTVAKSLDSALITQATLPVATQAYVNTQISAALLSPTFKILTATTFNVVDQIVFGAETATGLNMAGAPITMGGGVLSVGSGGKIDMGTSSIVNLATPVLATDAANKAYVDSAVLVSSSQQACALATDSQLTGFTFSSVANMMTASVNGALTVDGVSVIVGMRVLVKSNSVGPAMNGVYSVTSAGSASSLWVLTRASDFNTESQIFQGKPYNILQGTANTGQTFICQTTLTSGQLNTVAINFVDSNATLVSRTAVQGFSFVPVQYTNLTIPAGNFLCVPGAVQTSSGWVNSLSPSTCFILTSNPSTSSWIANVGNGQQVGDVLFICNANGGATPGIVTVMSVANPFIDGSGTQAQRLTFSSGQSGMFVWSPLGWHSVSNGYSAFAT